MNENQQSQRRFLGDVWVAISGAEFPQPLIGWLSVAAIVPALAHDNTV
jgi:hypothetical protein